MAYVQPNQLMMNSGGAGSHMHYGRQAHPPPHPSILRTPMPPYWVLPDGRRTEHVPRPHGLNPSIESFPGITFSTGGWPGVRVKDIFKGKVVDNSTDAVFAHLGWRATNVSLEWPGFKPCTVLDPSNYRLETTVGGRPITRQKLAEQIACLVTEVYDRAKGKPVPHGFEKWTLGENAIRPSDVIIMSVHYYRTVWIPELYVIE